jgi:5-methylcytosine-specific restriction endonuclease McrA
VVVVRPCLDCGALIPLGQGNRCPTHQRDKQASWSQGRDRSAQRRLRTALLKRAGNQCEAIDPKSGVRCQATTDLRACHITPLARGGGYDPEDARLLCRKHDKASDRYAR